MGAWNQSRASSSRRSSARLIPILFLPVVFFLSISSFYFLRQHQDLEEPFFQLNLPSAPIEDFVQTPSPDNSSALDLWPKIWRRVPLSSSEKFLAFTPHSGLHNQRLALINAAVIASLTNRTLVVPPLHLGTGVSWTPRPHLQYHLEQAENADIKRCREIKDGKARIRLCGGSWETERASWSWLIDSDALSDLVPIIDRTTFNRSWYLSSLGVSDEQIKEISDPYRRTWRIYDDASSPEAARLPEDESGYQWRMDITKLMTMNERVIEFGSLFGSTRLQLSTEANKLLFDQVERAMTFKQPVLHEASEALAVRMGGRSTYAGLHLRIGGSEKSGRFQKGARGRSAGVFRNLCRELGLCEEQIDELLLQNREHSDKPSYRPTPIPVASPSDAFHPSPKVRCPYKLYPSDSPLAALNLPIYAATDSRKPRRDPVLALFRNTFPCLVFFDDFRFSKARNGRKQSKDHFKQEAVPEVDFLMDEVFDKLDGEPLGSFLGPLAEAETIAKGKFVIGTPGSTFSEFAVGTLFKAYNLSSS